MADPFDVVTPAAEIAWGKYRDGPTYAPTDRYPVKDVFLAGYLAGWVRQGAEQAAGAAETPLGTPVRFPVGPRTPDGMAEPEDGERTKRCLNPLCGCGNRIPSEYPRNQCERDYGTCSVECALVYYGEEDVEFSHG